MSKLREMIEANKRKAEQNAQPVLQPQAVQKENNVKEGISGATHEPAGNSAGSVNQNSQPAGTSDNSVLGKEGPGTAGETSPPAGLTGLALIRWKKEHGNKAPQTAPQSNAGPAQNISGQPDKVSASNTPQSQGPSPNTAGGPSVEKSASGTADSQKSNNGTADLDALRGHLSFLAANITQKELVAQVVRTIAVQLQKTPELVGKMSEADVDLVVRGLRYAYSIAARKKAEIKETKSKNKADTSDLHKAFADNGLADAFASLKL